MPIDATLSSSNEATTNSVKAVSKDPIKLSVSGIMMDLENGLDRTAIATKYGMSTGEVNEVFKHPKLKGLRPKRKTTRITLIDDTEDDGTATSALLAEAGLSSTSETISPSTFEEFEN
jgi:hypothetical protein